MEKTTSGIPALNSRQYLATVGESNHKVQIFENGDIEVDNRRFSVSMVQSAQDSYSLIVDGTVHEVMISYLDHETGPNSLQLSLDDALYQVTVQDHKSLLRGNVLSAKTHSKSHYEIKAPMPGKVVRLEVSQGDLVKAGKGLVVLEAMKMENEIKSSADGTVDNVYVEPGRAVEKGEVLLSIKPN